MVRNSEFVSVPDGFSLLADVAEAADFVVFETPLAGIVCCSTTSNEFSADSFQVQFAHVVSSFSSRSLRGTVNSKQAANLPRFVVGLASCMVKQDQESLNGIDGILTLPAFSIPLSVANSTLYETSEDVS